MNKLITTESAHHFVALLQRYKLDTLPASTVVKITDDRTRSAKSPVAFIVKFGKRRDTLTVGRVAATILQTFRTDILSETVTFGEMVSVLPFPETVRKHKIAKLLK